MDSTTLSLGAGLVLLLGCSTPRGLLRPEVMDVSSNCNMLQVDAIDQFGTGQGAPPTDLVFSFTNRSTAETVRVDVAHMTLKDLGIDLPLNTSCHSLQLRPLEVRQCRVFWSSVERRHLSPGATFRVPVHCGSSADTARCVLR